MRHEVLHCRSGAAQNSGWHELIFRQIAPFGIDLVDERELPGTTSSFEISLARSRLRNRRVLLEIDQPNDAVCSGEARYCFRPMLKHPAMQIVREADVENAMTAVCQDVDEVAAHRQTPTLWAIPDLRCTAARCIASGMTMSFPHANHPHDRALRRFQSGGRSGRRRHVLGVEKTAHHND